MDAVAQILVGAAIAIVGTAFLAVPGFLLGGAFGLVLGRVARPTMRTMRIAVGLWILVCVAGAAYAVMAVAGAQHPDSLDSVGEAFYALLGIGSAVGGGYALYRGAIPGSERA
jgi:hypothetical protein